MLRVLGQVASPASPCGVFWRSLAAWGICWRVPASFGVRSRPTEVSSRVPQSLSPGGSLVTWRAAYPTVSVVGGGLDFGEPTPIAPVLDGPGLRRSSSWSSMSFVFGDPSLRQKVWAVWAFSRDHTALRLGWTSQGVAWFFASPIAAPLMAIRGGHGVVQLECLFVDRCIRYLRVSACWRVCVRDVRSGLACRGCQSCALRS